VQLDDDVDPSVPNIFPGSQRLHALAFESPVILPKLPTGQLEQEIAPEKGELVY
jgi:hypothetical protein